VSKERLQECKDHVSRFLYLPQDSEWLISEVERLQAYIFDETVPKQFDTGHLLTEKQEVERLYTESQQKVERLEKAKENFLKEFNYEYSWQIQNVKNSKSQWHKGALRGFEHSKEIFDRHFQALETEGKE
jgi:hypothetical protein